MNNKIVSGVKRFRNMLKKKFNELKNNEKKMRFVVIILCVIILLIVGFGIFFINGISTGDEIRFKREYEALNGKNAEGENEYLKINISSNNKMKYSDIDEVIDIFNNEGDAVIYIGYPSCVYCRSAVEVLCEATSDSDIDEVYYLDVEKKDDNYDKLVNILDDKFTVDEKKEEIYTPLVLFVANGQIVSYNKGTFSAHKDPYKQFDKYQKEGLKEVYSYGINDVVNNIKLKESFLED